MAELKKQRRQSSNITKMLNKDDFFNNNTSNQHSINTESSYSRESGLWNNSINNEPRNRKNGGYDSNYHHTKDMQSINPTGFIFEGMEKVFSSKRHGILNKLKDTPRNVDKKLFEKQLKRKREGIHILDKIARYLFPISFLIFNIIYFVYAMEQKKPNHSNEQTDDHAH